MEINVYQLLHENALLLLFVVIGIGYLIGKIKIFGVPVDPTIGVLLTALLFGHHQLTISDAVGTFGFTLFIFSIGLQAGPSFFSAFREDGPKYIVLAVIVSSIGFLLAWGAAQVFSFDDGFGAGLLAGALTSTPTLAGAQDAIRSGLAVIPEGMTAAKLQENVGVGYALTYLIGTVLIIIIFRYVPRIFNMNLEAMARTYAKEKGLLRKRGWGESTADTLPIIRAYRVAADSNGKTIEQRKAELNMPGVPLRLRRGNEILKATADLELKEGDVISLIASLNTHEWAQKNLGAEVLDHELLNYRIDAHEIVVLSKYAIGKSVKDLDLPRTHGCWVNGLVRAGIELPVTEGVVLLKGDQLHVVGEESRLRSLADQIGYLEEEVEETDLVIFSFGIAAGLLLGMIVINAAGVSIGLGSAGGLLIMGIVIGYLGSINPTFGRVPSAARYLLKELGLMLLMASIGLNAGAGMLEGLASLGPTMILSAIVVAVVPLTVGYIAGRLVLKLNPALLLGSLTGAMTSTPALAVVTDTAKSSVPAIGYAGTYTFANILLTFGGTYMMML